MLKIQSDDFSAIPTPSQHSHQNLNLSAGTGVWSLLPLPSPPPDLPHSPPTQDQSFSGTRPSASLDATPIPTQNLAPTGPAAPLLRDCSLVISSKKPPICPRTQVPGPLPRGPCAYPHPVCLSDSSRDVSSLRTETMDNCVPGKMCNYHFQKAQTSRLGCPAP